MSLELNISNSELEMLYKKCKTKKALAKKLNVSEWEIIKLLAKRGIVKLKNKIKKHSETFISKAISKHGNAYDYSETNYKRSCLKVKIKCNRCGKYFYQTPNNHLNGQGCPYCKDKKSSEKQRKSIDAFIEQATNIHGDLYDYSYVDYKGAKTQVKILCKNCNQFFYQTPDKHINSKQGCPYCKSRSKGEKSVEKFLNDNHIQFVSQKKFKECRDKRVLPFDFYLPDYNVCIEYQGRQHYGYKGSSKFFKKEDDYLLLQKHDEIKRKFCNDRKIKLFEINYKVDFTLQLEEIKLYLDKLMKKER